MNLELPVICFDVDTNRYATENLSGYFNNSEELSKLLSALTDAELKINAASMLEIAKRKYSWLIITKKYAKLFQT
jgi:glycosyltransferase involved in cell wall biosynthesis